MTHRIIHIIPNLKMGGAERICIDICRVLLEQNHKVLVILLEKAIEYNDLPENLDITIYPHKAEISLIKKSKNVESLIKLVRAFNPTVVHTHLFEAELLWKTTELKIPSIFHIHDNIKILENHFFKKPNKTNLIKLYEKICYLRYLKKQPTTFLCVSKNTRDYILNHRIKSTVLLYNAINFRKFRNDNIKKLDKIELVSIGSLVQNKGQLFSIKVILELTKLTSKKIHLNVLGDGPMYEEINAEIINKNLSGIISLIGKQTKPERYLQNANIFIHTSYEESFGLVLLEAMAAGVVVFTTDGGGNRELITHKSNGFIYSNRNEKEIAKDILDIIENKEKFVSITNKALEFSKQFDIYKYTENLLKIYDSISIKN